MGGSWSSEESEEQEGRVLCGRSWPTRETVPLWLREVVHFIETDRSGRKIIRFWTAPFLRQPVSRALVTIEPRSHDGCRPLADPTLPHTRYLNRQ